MAEQRVTDDSSGFTLSCRPSHDGTQVRVIYNTADRLHRKVYDFAPTWPRGCDPVEAARLVCRAVNQSRDDLMDARAELARYKAAVVEAHQVMEGAIIRGGYQPGEAERVAELLGIPVED